MRCRGAVESRAVVLPATYSGVCSGGFRGLFIAGDGWIAVHECGESLATDGVLKLADGFGFDLSDALAGDFEDAADFFEGVGVSIADAVAEFEDFALAV